MVEMAGVQLQCDTMLRQYSTGRQ